MELLHHKFLLIVGNSGAFMSSPIRSAADLDDWFTEKPPIPAATLKEAGSARASGHMSSNRPGFCLPQEPAGPGTSAWPQAPSNARTGQHAELSKAPRGLDQAARALRD